MASASMYRTCDASRGSSGACVGVRDRRRARLLGGRREVGAQPAHGAADVLAHLRGTFPDGLRDALLEVASSARRASSSA